MNKEIRAVIWDFDGTISDTSKKNLNITKKIYERVTSNKANEVFALKSKKNYLKTRIKTKNKWRDFYEHELGLKGEKIDEAGSLWSEYQLKDKTPMPVYKGIPEVVRALKRFPQSIVSENSKDKIKELLQQANLLKYFDDIIGYEEVGLKKPKPDPTGLLMCINKLTNSKQGYIIYIGDLEIDVEMVAKANKLIRQKGLDTKVVIVITTHGSYSDDWRGWASKPDFVAKQPLEIIDAIQRFNPDYKIKGGVLVPG